MYKRQGYDDIFSTDQSRAEAQQERGQEIPLSELHPFEGHPFRVVDDVSSHYSRKLTESTGSENGKFTFNLATDNTYQTNKYKIQVNGNRKVICGRLLLFMRIFIARQTVLSGSILLRHRNWHRDVYKRQVLYIRKLLNLKICRLTKNSC